MFNAAVGYHNDGIIRQHSPDSLTARYHDFTDAALALVNLHIADMSKPLAVFDIDNLFLFKLRIQQKNHFPFTQNGSLPYTMPAEPKK